MTSLKAAREAENKRQKRLFVLQQLCDKINPKCACCPEATYSFLTVDHIHGGGVQERKTSGPTSTWVLVFNQHKNGTPWEELRKKYQVLCANCNQGRRVDKEGICPHQKPTALGTGSIMITIPFDMVKSYVKVFAATVLGLFLSDGADVFNVSWTDLRTWLAAGVASVLPLIITALDKTDPRWGRTE
jgi:hypothetical protein